MITILQVCIIASGRHLPIRHPRSVSNRISVKITCPAFFSEGFEPDPCLVAFGLPANFSFGLWPFALVQKYLLVFEKASPADSRPAYQKPGIRSYMVIVMILSLKFLFLYMWFRFSGLHALINNSFAALFFNLYADNIIVVLQSSPTIFYLHLWFSIIIDFSCFIPNLYTLACQT